MFNNNGFWLMQGDCLERMKEIPSGSVDMVLTDPPYGMNLTPQRVTGKFHGKKIENDNQLGWSDEFFAECFRLLPKVGAAMVFCSHHCVAEFILSARSAGFTIKNMMIWDKGQFGIGGNWRPQHELVLLCTKGRFVTRSNSLSTIMRFKKVHHSKSQHPTQKPVDMLVEMIEQPDYSPEIILDPFMGSGSTGVACANTGRKFIGIELDLNYFNIALERIEAAHGITK